LWKEGGKELRRSASNMKQDFYLIIQAKPPKDRPLFRSLYSSLFNSITKVHLSSFCSHYYILITINLLTILWKW
jgi:hypothetical protein